MAPASCQHRRRQAAILGIGARGHTAETGPGQHPAAGADHRGAVDHWVDVLQRCRHRVAGAAAMCIAGADAAINALSQLQAQPAEREILGAADHHWAVALTGAGVAEAEAQAGQVAIDVAGAGAAAQAAQASQRVGADAEAVDDRVAVADDHRAAEVGAATIGIADADHALEMSPGCTMLLSSCRLSRLPSSTPLLLHSTVVESCSPSASLTTALHCTSLALLTAAGLMLSALRVGARLSTVTLALPLALAPAGSVTVAVQLRPSVGMALVLLQVKGGTAVAAAAHRPLIDRGQAAIVGIAAAGAAGQREVIGDAAGRADADGAELGLGVRDGDAGAAGRTVDIAIIGRDQHRPQLAHGGVGGGHAGASVGADAAIDAPLVAVGDGIAIGIAGAAGADRQIIGGQRGIR